MGRRCIRPLIGRVGILPGPISLPYQFRADHPRIWSGLRHGLTLWSSATKPIGSEGRTSRQRSIPQQKIDQRLRLVQGKPAVAQSRQGHDLGPSCQVTISPGQLG